MNNNNLKISSNMAELYNLTNYLVDTWIFLFRDAINLFG
jgi:hypothetical protein